MMLQSCGFETVVNITFFPTQNTITLITLTTTLKDNYISLLCLFVVGLGFFVFVVVVFEKIPTPLTDLIHL